MGNVCKSEKSVPTNATITNLIIAPIEPEPTNEQIESKLSQPIENLTIPEVNEDA